MKKYVLGLVILIAQNVCAMEKEETSSQNKVKKLDPFAIMRENDEKCKLVAKYLYKYGLGKNNEEVAQTESFFAAKSEPEKSLALCILKYGTMLKNIDREETWRLMYEKHFYRYEDETSLPIYENVPNEIKQTILNDALYFHIADYCARVSTLEFLKLDLYGKSFLVGTGYWWISCIPHFLLEVTEGSCDTGDHRYKCGNASIGLIYDGPNGPFVHYFFGTSSTWQGRRATQELISFLNAKDERINYFKEMLSGIVKPFVTEEPVSFDTFVDLLKTVKDLTEREDFKIKKENSKSSPKYCNQNQGHL